MSLHSCPQGGAAEQITEYKNGLRKAGVGGRRSARRLQFSCPGLSLGAGGASGKSSGTGEGHNVPALLDVARPAKTVKILF